MMDFEEAYSILFNAQKDKNGKPLKGKLPPTAKDMQSRIDNARYAARRRLGGDDPRIDEVFAMMKQTKDGITSKMISDELRISVSNAGDILRRMFTRGEVTKRTKKRGSFVVYELQASAS